MVVPELVQRVAASGPLMYIGAVMVTDAPGFMRVVGTVLPAFRAFPYGRPEPPKEPTPLATAVARASGVCVSVVAFLTLAGLLS